MQIMAARQISVTNTSIEERGGLDSSDDHFTAGSKGKNREMTDNFLVY